MMCRIKNLPLKLVVTGAVLLYAILLYLSPFSCFFLDVFGIRCPGCGMTRALLAALRLDFHTAFSYHAMFWSVPILYLCFLFDGKLFRNRWINLVFYTLIVVGFLVNWLV